MCYLCRNDTPILCGLCISKRCARKQRKTPETSIFQPFSGFLKTAAKQNRTVLILRAYKAFCYLLDTYAAVCRHEKRAYLPEQIGSIIRRKTHQIVLCDHNQLACLFLGNLVYGIPRLGPDDTVGLKSIARLKLHNRELGILSKFTILEAADVAIRI